MEKSYKVKMILFPIIVTLITMLSIWFVEGTFEGELSGFGFVELALFVMFFLGIYLFTIVTVVPINIYISKKIRNKLISFIVFNIIGLVLIVCIDIWFLTVIEFKSLYSLFPLFSIFSLVLESEKNN